MNNEYAPDKNFDPWGPFIGKNFENEKITYTDIIIASVAWGLSLLFLMLALYLAWIQTKTSRSPLRSVYVWLIWLELAASFLMGIESYLHILKIIRPSIYLFLSIVTWWSIQVQLLLQIIINRIRVIIPDRRLSRRIMIVTAVIVTAINISVFCIWVPARLQTNEMYIHVNQIWDRIEKVIYLIIDGSLNWYFLKVVKANLINNGLQKYNKLFKYNQRIIIVSLSMDVMIIAAMSVPNSLVYLLFHPLAYIVKLNIEVAMANLIKRIAVSTSKRTGNVEMAQEFISSSNKSSTNPNISSRPRGGSFIELSDNMFSKVQASHKVGRGKSMAPGDNEIKQTREIHIQTDPNPEYAEHDGSGLRKEEFIIQERGIGKTKSLDDVTEGGESMKSEEPPRRDDSSDEVVLVREAHGGWEMFPK
ncbi:hypothetical protein CC78DRAFT_612945 [Lojkania enalia]|uniref:Uncharacterized protein n=1 Tax=Lojkania enalia TaxID=147567 RepID=A0A9P4KIL8_9PLEO|nr:hypothetical protein CC78DRAFT_612945 [Didymosphaeria enalia]